MKMSVSEFVHSVVMFPPCPRLQIYRLHTAQSGEYDRAVECSVHNTRLTVHAAAPKSRSIQSTRSLDEEHISTLARLFGHHHVRAKATKRQLPSSKQISGATTLCRIHVWLGTWCTYANDGNKKSEHLYCLPQQLWIWQWEELWSFPKTVNIQRSMAILREDIIFRAT